MEFYKPQQGDTAGTVADGYDRNFRELSETKVDRVEGSGLMTDEERGKLSGIENGANAYEHPDSHPADMISDTEEKVMMTAEEREKLSGIENGANAYELPPASGFVLGGVKVGTGLEIAEDGTLSAPGGSGGEYVLPKASAATLGGIKVGNNLSIREDGTLDAQAGSGGSGTGTEKLVLPYIEPAYGDDGGLTNKEAFIEAWGPVMEKYRTDPDNSRLFMEMPFGIGTEMADVPCQTMITQDMGEEEQALLLSAYGAACIPGGPGVAIPLGVFAGATIMFDASGEVMSVEYPAYAPAMTGADMPNMVLQKVYIDAEDFSKSGDELKTAMQPYIDAIRSNPMAEAVMVDTKNGWIIPVVITRWMGDSDPTNGGKYILQGNLHHIVENEDEKIGGVSSFVTVCDVDASGTIVTASSFSADSDWVTAEAMNAALAKKADVPASASATGLMSAEDRIKLNSVASALSLSVVTEDTPMTLEETDEDTAPAMAATLQACIRAQRAAQYQMQTDELLYDALEAFARNHPEYSEFAAWLEAKDRIRQELPKPGATDMADGPETDGELQNSDAEPAAEQKGGEE